MPSEIDQVSVFCFCCLEDAVFHHFGVQPPTDSTAYLLLAMLKALAASDLTADKEMLKLPPSGINSALIQ
jgi:hypothetical protein